MSIRVRLGLATVAFVAMLAVATLGRAQQFGDSVPLPSPVILSGPDVGFRIDGRYGDTPIGAIVVRIDGKWVEAKVGTLGPPIKKFR
jgi:hypothetical protein